MRYLVTALLIAAASAQTNTTATKTNTTTTNNTSSGNTTASTQVSNATNASTAANATLTDAQKKTNFKNFVTGQPGAVNPYNITAQHQKLSIDATGNATANATANATKGAKPGISLDVSYYIAPAPDGSHYMQTKFAISAGDDAIWTSDSVFDPWFQVGIPMTATDSKAKRLLQATNSTMTSSTHYLGWFGNMKINNDKITTGSWWSTDGMTSMVNGTAAVGSNEKQPITDSKARFNFQDPTTTQKLTKKDAVKGLLNSMDFSLWGDTTDLVNKIDSSAVFQSGLSYTPKGGNTTTIGYVQAKSSVNSFVALEATTFLAASSLIAISAVIALF